MSSFQQRPSWDIKKLIAFILRTHCMNNESNKQESYCYTHIPQDHTKGLPNPRLSLPKIKGNKCVEKRKIREEKEFPGF